MTTRPDKLEYYKVWNDWSNEMEWRWRVTAANGEVVDASHEGFTRKWSAKRNFRRKRKVEG